MTGKAYMTWSLKGLVRKNDLLPTHHHPGPWNLPGAFHEMASLHPPHDSSSDPALNLKTQLTAQATLLCPAIIQPLFLPLGLCLCFFSPITWCALHLEKNGWLLRVFKFKFKKKQQLQKTHAEQEKHTYAGQCGPHVASLWPLIMAMH